MLKLFLRKIIYLILGQIDTILNRQPKVFILCYHSIANDSWRFGVSLSTIEKQLRYLKSKYTPITIADIQDIVSGKKIINNSAFVVTFDDGYKEVLRIRHLVKSLGIQPAFFVLTNTKTPNYKELTTKRDFLSVQDIKDLIQDGWDLGCHGATHSDFWELSDEQINDEVTASKQYLEKTFNIPVRFFAYPRGRYTKKILTVVRKSGYQLALSMDDGSINRHTNRLIVPRVGVDRTHSFEEFKTLFLPSVIAFRKFIKEHIGVIV